MLNLQIILVRPFLSVVDLSLQIQCIYFSCNLKQVVPQSDEDYLLSVPEKGMCHNSSLHTYFTVTYLTDDLDVNLHWGLRLLMSMFGSGCLVAIFFNWGKGTKIF